LLQGYVAQPWTLYQFLIIAACFGVAYLLSLKIEPALEERARQIKGNPGLLRVIIAFMRRTEWVIFLVFLAVAREAILMMTWPSRSYMLSLALVLGFTWLAASVLTRIIRSRSLARFVAFCIFVYVAVGVLDVRDEAQTFLDGLAVNLGDFRLSALFVLRAIAVTTVLLWVAHIAGSFIASLIATSSDLSPSFKVLAGKVVSITLTVLAGMIALNAIGVDLTALTVFFRRGRRRARLRAAESGVEFHLRRDHPCRQVDQAGRHDRTGRHVRMDPRIAGPLRLGDHPRRA
jgi:small-conductance mechanosensitive channel